MKTFNELNHKNSMKKIFVLLMMALATCNLSAKSNFVQVKNGHFVRYQLLVWCHPRFGGAGRQSPASLQGTRQNEGDGHRQSAHPRGQ